MIFPFFPFLLLVTALIGIYLYQRLDNQVYQILAASLAIVCLIWGFSVAHWSLHLFCLVFLFKPNLLFGNRKSSLS